MSFGQKYILCFGMDQLLLETRRQMLKQFGCEMRTTSDGLTVKQCLLNREVSVLILCQTLSREQVLEICAYHAAVQSTASILYFRREYARSVPVASQIFDPLNGPAAFVATVGRMASCEPSPPH